MLTHMITSLTRLQTSCVRAIRHPASGYVQGINDLVTPFLAVFLSEILEGDMEQWDAGSLSPETLYTVEADCYWCLCKLLDGIQVGPGSRTVSKKLDVATGCFKCISPLETALLCASNGNGATLHVLWTKRN